VLVVDERTRKPLSDEQRAELLRANGIVVDLEMEPAPWSYL